MPSAGERISIKQEQISSYLVYNIVSLGKMAGKAEHFSWRSVEDELAVKYLEYLDAENLQLFWMMLNTVFSHL